MLAVQPVEHDVDCHRLMGDVNRFFFVVNQRSIQLIVETYLNLVPTEVPALAREGVVFWSKRVPPVIDPWLRAFIYGKSTVFFSTKSVLDVVNFTPGKQIPVQQSSETGRE